MVGAITRGLDPVDALVEFATIDGLDAQTAASRIIDRALTMYEVSAVFLDGVTYAGFNIVDPEKLWNEFSVPTIVVFRHKLYLDKIENALRNHFLDWRYRFEVIARVYSRSVEVSSPIGYARITTYGISFDDAKSLLESLRTVFPEPQPLKLADILASAIARYVMRATDAET